jgi:formylmethanofuran dehydrogenase subunit E
MANPKTPKDPGELVQCESCGDKVPAETTHKTDIGILCDDCWERQGYHKQSKPTPSGLRGSSSS